MKSKIGLMLSVTMLLFASAVFADHAPPNQTADNGNNIENFHDSGDAGALDGFKIFAIMPGSFIFCSDAVQNPTEGLKAYGWDKDKRSRLNYCRNNC